MPPKPRPLRKGSTSKDTLATATVDKDVKKNLKDSMPPPPDPLPPTSILEPEINALSSCLKNAVIMTAQIYGFYADTRKLGIVNYAPNPPRSLTASLGREVERYDQLCDSIESQLLQAISVLQRDLAREEQRIKDVETASISTRTRSKSTSLSPTSVRVPLPLVADPQDPTHESEPPRTQALQSQASPPPPGPPGRRPSAISISSLHRPPFPLKLDLSSSALRITAEEASLFSNGLASPVTLAPKSARPMGPSELPPDLMAAFVSSDAASRPVDIDLTNDGGDNDVEMNLDPSLGSSVDKPIELDLEAMDLDMSNMNDLFGDDASSGDANAAVDGLFSPVNGSGIETSTSISGGDAVKSIKEEEKFGMDILDALTAAGVGDDENEELFGPLSHDESPTNHQGVSQSQSLSGTSGSALQSSASPSLLLANFASNSAGHASSSNSHSLTEENAHFDLDTLDLSNLGAGFFGDTQESESNIHLMEEFLNMGSHETTEPGANIDINKGTT